MSSVGRPATLALPEAVPQLYGVQQYVKPCAQYMEAEVSPHLLPPLAALVAQFESLIGFSTLHHASEITYKRTSDRRF